MRMSFLFNRIRAFKVPFKVPFKVLGYDYYITAVINICSVFKGGIWYRIFSTI